MTKNEIMAAVLLSEKFWNNLSDDKKKQLTKLIITESGIFRDERNNEYKSNLCF